MAQISLLNDDQIPGHGRLPEVGKWLPEYLKLQELKGKVEALDREIGELHRSPGTHDDMLGEVRAEWEQRRQERVLYLKRHFERRMQGRASLSYIQSSTDGFDWPMLPPWDIIEEAVRSLPEGISEAQKQKKLSKLEKEKAEFLQQIEKLSPREYFSKGRDLRKQFFEHWEAFQSRANGPCGPNGQALDQCSKEIQRAWETLKLQDLVNGSSKHSPHFTKYQV